jgi:hypothetical protein
MVVISFCLFHLGGCISRWVSDFVKAGFIGFKKSVLVLSNSVVGIVQAGR